ncbi:MAG: excinuclease ABC subunit UvrB [Alistipes sp.]|nr:excinuclease ABC subunit UvrB [Alistipes sp.]
MDFKLVSDYKPAGDQPKAIEQLVTAVNNNVKCSTLLGVTGSGKTFTMANVIAQTNRPTLVLCHNKTLAAQLYSEFKNFFPENAVEYFVSYYDYYQPEAYIPSTHTYIEKELMINDDIERLRLKTVSSLLSGRNDVIVVSSVSCIYGCGNPEDFHATSIELEVGQRYQRNALLRRFVEALYTRTEFELKPATFRVTGETIDIMAAFGEFGDQCFRLTFFDDEIDQIHSIDPATGQKLASLQRIRLYPTNLFVTTQERIGKATSEIMVDLGKQIKFFEDQGLEEEAQRIKQRVEYDVEMIKELGYCSGIENYSRYFDGRPPGSRPFCLLDFFPKDFLTIIDESHVTVPQIGGMYGGDRARKENLVDYGYRLPAAKDNRPLKFHEWEALTPLKIFVSATPADYEIRQSEGIIIEQVVRPTYLVDPYIEVRPTANQIDDILDAINTETHKGNKVLVTTLSRRMAEELSQYFDRIGIRNRYLHCGVETLQRVEVLDSLRDDMIDVIVGVNLLREGLDLPDVSLVAIFDADKEGFLRTARSMTQTAGRAARHPNGYVIMYADTISRSMHKTIAETNRRREIQALYNLEHHTKPRKAQKSGSGQSALLGERGEQMPKNITAYPIVEDHYAPAIAAEESVEYTTPESIREQIAKAHDDMIRAAKSLDYAAAARYRDQMRALEKLLK